MDQYHGKQRQLSQRVNKQKISRKTSLSSLSDQTAAVPPSPELDGTPLFHNA